MYSDDRAEGIVMSDHYHGNGIVSRGVGVAYQVLLGNRVIATCPDISTCHLVADSVALIRSFKGPHEPDRSGKKEQAST